MRAPNILIVDDNEKIRKVVHRILHKLDAEIYQAASGEEALEMIDQKEIDLVLLDIMMPIMDGYELCKTIRKNFIWNEIYIIFLSAKSEDLDRAIGLRYGANDYISKPFEVGDLLRKVEEGLAVITHSMHTTRDSLTQLYNRFYFNQRYHEEVARANRYRYPLSILLVSIDNFDNLTREYGLLPIDQVLIIMAKLIHHLCRKTDLAARLGERIFAILLPGTDFQGGQELVERFRDSLKEAVFPEIENLEVNLGVGSGCEDSLEALEQAYQELTAAATAKGKDQNQA